jgi:hypothetical protein
MILLGDDVISAFKPHGLQGMTTVPWAEFILEVT